MADKLNGVATVVNVGGKTVTVDGSTDLSDLDAKTLQAVRDAGGIVDSEAGSDEQATLASQVQGTVITPSSTVLQIAAHIESGDDGKPLNAAQTVELAGGDPAQAAKVLEAESLAQGGDGRTTVVKPLQAIVSGSDDDEGDE